MTAQSREPAGSPDGGRFREADHSESTDELDEDDGLGWDGSFHAVPRFSTAVQVFNFFSEHPPPDSTVFRLRRLANVKAEATAKAKWEGEFKRRIFRWDAENPKPTVGKRQQEAANAEHGARRDAYADDVRRQLSSSEEYSPFRMDPHSAYRATLALGRWHAARFLPQDERAELESMPSGWGDSDGTPMSIAELVRDQSLEEIADTVLDPESDQREMMELLREVRRVQGLTAHSSHQAAVALQDMAYYEDPR